MVSPDKVWYVDDLFTTDPSKTHLMGVQMLRGIIGGIPDTTTGFTLESTKT